MANVVVPPGENLHRALRWLDEERSARPDAPVLKIIEEACVRFDLSPGEEQWLVTLFLIPPTMNP